MISCADIQAAVLDEIENGAASAAADDCETCGMAADYGESHCPRCRRLWRLVNIGGRDGAEALRRLNGLSQEAAD
jgi:hypothetical protein